MDALGQAFAPAGAQTPVRFPFQTKGRISHHLMFISKHPLGNEIMKGVMSGESTLGMFGYDQAAEKQPLLFQDLPVEALSHESCWSASPEGPFAFLRLAWNGTPSSVCLRINRQFRTSRARRM